LPEETLLLASNLQPPAQFLPETCQNFGRILLITPGKPSNDRRSSKLGQEQAARVKAEAAESKFRSLLEAAPDGIVIVNVKGEIVLVNRQAEQLFGYQREDLLGKGIEMLIPDRFRTRHAQHRSGYFAAPATRPMGAGIELSALRRDGSEFPAEISLSPLQTEEGLLITSVIRDVTEKHTAAEVLRKAHDQLEIRVQERTAELLKANEEKQQVLERLLRAEKLAEIGQLAAGVAHEIRNPLAGIRGAIEVLHGGKAEGDPERPIMDEIMLRVDRLNSAVQDLLEYARPTAPQRSTVRLSEVLDGVLSTLMHDPRLRGIDVVRDDHQPIQVETDITLLERVFINIVLNAAQAMNSSGALHIRLATLGTSAVISFQDTGPGIEPDTLEKIFNPFFTTRSEGSGLGLALCKKYVELLGGKIDVASRVGFGTTFSISLPMHGLPG
jgi:two-component system, LuxR family, sensor kinase FixL